MTMSKSRFRTRLKTRFFVPSRMNDGIIIEDFRMVNHGSVGECIASVALSRPGSHIHILKFSYQVQDVISRATLLAISM
jgi:hypothetical protein